MKVVTKILSCWVNITSRCGIKQLGVSSGSIFLLFANEISWGHIPSSWGKSWPPALNNNPVSVMGRPQPSWISVKTTFKRQSI